MLALAAAVSLPVAAQAPALSNLQRGQAKRMLKALESAMREKYYDASFRGRDLEQHFADAAAKIDAAEALPHAYGIIAQTLVDFEDSHTLFIPPQRASLIEYGWDMRMVGDACFITSVEPGSDAEAKGLKRGDRLLQVDQFVPYRHDLWKMRYLLYTLSPRSRLRLVVQSPGDAAPRTLDVATKITPQESVVRLDLGHLDNMLWQQSREARRESNQFARAGDVAVWRLSSFGFDASDADGVVDTAVKDASALVIDMRGNPGGYIKTLERITSRLFDRTVTIATVKTRKSSKPLTVKKRKTPFTGQIVALVDADSGSAAELLARLLQLEERAVVIGDRSSGKVMQAELVTGAIDTVQGMMIYHASITTADLIMSDGRSLENAGVVPDELVLPTVGDIAAGRDPVLARAIMMLGGTIDAAEAGALFR